MNFKVNDWVWHPIFGDGEVQRADGDKYVVRFVAVGEKLLVKTAITSPGAPPHPEFKFPKTATKPRFRVQPPKQREIFTFDHLVSGFTSFFPDGFEGAKFDEHERAYKQQAAQLLADSLGGGTLQRLAAAEDYGGVCDRAMKVVQATNLIFKQEKIQLKAALARAENQKTFSQGLEGLLGAELPEENAFESFVEALSRINALKWTTATYFQFLHSNGERMFMKPAVMQRMSDSVNVALNYRVEPNWLTYCKLQDLARRVTEELTSRGLRPRSPMDTQGFIWSSIRLAEGKYGLKTERRSKRAAAGREAP